VPAAELSAGRASAVVARTDRKMKLELKCMVMVAIKWLVCVCVERIEPLALLGKKLE